ncbi:PAS domain S-box protein, partial [bacterium]|nr:PAS domain S-box protein [bacterium]
PPTQSPINVFLNICFFYLVAFLSGFLAEKLRRKGEELESTSRRLRKVQLDTDDILANMNSGLVTVDGEGIIQHFNRAAEKILGLEASQIKNKPFGQVFGGENRELKVALNSALERGMVNSRTELMAVSRQGRSMPLGISTTLLGVGEGERGGVIAVFQDLTEAKELEQRAREADRLAVLGQLSAAIAHEIRNPLATISGSIEMLSESLQLAGEEQKLMGLVTRESDRLNRIITDFLLYARIRPADKTVVDVVKLVNETLTLVRNHVDFHDGIEIVNEAEVHKAYALADQDQVRQIFLNIAINALQAMSHGGRLVVGLVEGPSRARVRGKDEMVKVFFQDAGVGIPAGELKSIFEPFYSSKKGGTGLGLSIAQRIVENNGGKLEVESHKGRGTTFTVSLIRGERIQ